MISQKDRKALKELVKNQRQRYDAASRRVTEAKTDNSVSPFAFSGLVEGKSNIHSEYMGTVDAVRAMGAPDFSLCLMDVWEGKLA